MEEKSLQDICRKAKDERHITLQALSDSSGVPLSSVNNFFASASKAPSVYNAGHICAALGVSLDEYFTIQQAAIPEELQAERERRHAAELEIARLRGIADKQAAIISMQRKNSFVMAGVSFAAVVALLIRYLVFDHSVPTAGLVIEGTATLGAWLLIIGVAALGILMAALLLRTAMKNTPKIESEQEAKP